MTLVLLTAVATWVFMQAMRLFSIAGDSFIIESTIAVVGGAAVGLIGSWYLRRQARKERREDRRD